jgi:cytochrome c
MRGAIRAAGSAIVAACVLAACGHAKPPAGPPPSPTDDGEVQAARGATEFAEHCASCHGDQGQGSKKAPPLVGPDALPQAPRATAKFRKGQFNTALDVALFVVENMPADAPGTLKESVYWDILAFDLKANGVKIAGKHLDAASAADIKLH